MSEITKLYENAGVEYYDRYFSCKKDEDLTCQDNCEICDNAKEVKCYPPFTAEKQIELIKWLMCKKQTIQVELRLYENDYCISHITECEDNDTVEYVETGRKNTFGKALADLVNELWQDLTEEEKQQVKGVLE